ncbi:MAG TPA: hypothetical protein VEA59_01465 [Patescibacteria group bacterium]|nr:hypothetical protein [Patescibacteria group bacterium]
MTDIDGRRPCEEPDATNEREWDGAECIQLEPDWVEVEMRKHKARWPKKVRGRDTSFTIELMCKCKIYLPFTCWLFPQGVMYLIPFHSGCSWSGAGLHNKEYLQIMKLILRAIPRQESDNLPKVE